MGVSLLGALLEPATAHGVVHTLRVALVATTAVSVSDFWAQIATSDKRPKLHPKIAAAPGNTEVAANVSKEGEGSGESLTWDPYTTLMRGYGYGALLTPLLFPFVPTLFAIPAKQPLVPSLYCLGWASLVILPIGGAIHFFFSEDRKSLSTNSLRIFVGVSLVSALSVFGVAAGTGSLLPLVPFSEYGNRDLTKVWFNSCGMLVCSAWVLYSSSYYVKWYEKGKERHQNSCTLEVGNIICYTIGLGSTTGLCTLLTWPTTSHALHWLGAGVFFSGMACHCLSATAMEHCYTEDHHFGALQISCASLLLPCLFLLYPLKGSGWPVLVDELAILTLLNLWFYSLTEVFDEPAQKKIAIRELSEDLKGE